MYNITLLLAGCLCAGLGGEMFLRGITNIATLTKVTPAIIAVTFAAFATSSPELSVSITSSLEQEPQIALGDALGSNIVNIALILGISSLIAPIHLYQGKHRRDYAAALCAPLLLAILGHDSMLGNYDAWLLLAAFSTWLGMVLSDAHKQRCTSGPSDYRPKISTTLLLCVGGLACLVTAGKLIVTGAQGIAISYGLDEFVIGALLVAVGTSAPELATAVIAKLRGHDEISIGTLLGSNIFNCLFIVSTAAMIHPITFDWGLFSTSIAIGTIATVTIAFTAKGVLTRHHGLVLIAIYLSYIAFTV